MPADKLKLNFCFLTEYCGVYSNDGEILFSPFVQITKRQIRSTIGYASWRNVNKGKKKKKKENVSFLYIYSSQCLWKKLLTCLWIAKEKISGKSEWLLFDKEKCALAVWKIVAIKCTSSSTIWKGQLKFTVFEGKPICKHFPFWTELRYLPQHIFLLTSEGKTSVKLGLLNK